MRAAFTASYLLLVEAGRQDNGFDFPRCDVVQRRDNMVELSQVRYDGRGANWASTWRNHTSGRVVQNGGSLMETDETAAGAVG